MLCNLRIFLYSLLFGIAFLMKNFSFGQSQVDSPILEKALVKYVTATDNKLLFRVQLDNETGKKFRISITDENEVSLFREVYSDKYFNRQFQFDKSELDDSSTLTFTISNTNGRQSQKFKIKKQVIEEIVVSTL